MGRIQFIVVLFCCAFQLLDGRNGSVSANISSKNAGDFQVSGRLMTAVSQAKIDQLFARLKRARSESEGRMIELELWQYWTKSGNSRIEDLMRRAHFLAQQGDLELSVRLLDRVVVERPGFVDGWNRRANVFYLMRRYNEALYSIAKVLDLEPRHFGALTGKAFINISKGRWQEALECLRRAVEIHPFLHERYMVRLLEKKLRWRRL